MLRQLFNDMRCLSAPNVDRRHRGCNLLGRFDDLIRQTGHPMTHRTCAETVLVGEMSISAGDELSKDSLGGLNSVWRPLACLSQLCVPGPLSKNPSDAGVRQRPSVKAVDHDVSLQDRTGCTKYPICGYLKLVSCSPPNGM